jgi:hypothetical protein
MGARLAPHLPEGEDVPGVDGPARFVAAAYAAFASDIVTGSERSVAFPAGEGPEDRHVATMRT